MNAQFASYTTSKAFTFSMTQTQAESLAFIYWHCRCYDSYGAVASLLRKGLIEAIGSLKGEYTTYYRCTKAGSLMYQLLQEAGLTGYVPEPKGWAMPSVILQYQSYTEPLPVRTPQPHPATAAEQK